VALKVTVRGAAPEVTFTPAVAVRPGVGVGGPHGPYIQSLRIATYREHANRLVASGSAYWCTCTPARLAAMLGRKGQGFDACNGHAHVRCPLPVSH